VTEADGERGVRDLLALLALERVDEAVVRPTFYADTGEISFVYGGQLLAQSVVAAAATVDADRRTHSVHGHFLRAGAPDRPYEIAVTEVREGGSFSTRRVEIGHDHHPFFVATVSFAKARTEGFGGRPLAEYQRPLPVGAGDPDGRGPWSETPPFATPWAAYQLLEFDVLEPDAHGHRAYDWRLWVRLREDFPAGDPVLGAAALAFASDLRMVVAGSVTEGTHDQMHLVSSLDHALWLHRPSDLREWHLVDLVSLSNSEGRSVVRASIHRRDGTLVASVAQEVLIR
jgi:acyl-CoA thioesterase